MLELQKFIKEHDNFRELLAEKPYYISIQEDQHFILFKYSQIHSDFSNQLVRECRGIILDKADYSIAAHPFHKFGNFGESYVPEIDWKSASVQSKKDGSLIKLWYNKYEDMWQVSTNGTIDAHNADLTLQTDNIKNFYDLFMDTLDKMGISFLTLTSMMNKEFTHLFELCSLQNKVVIPYETPVIYHLATKHNNTGEEIEQVIMLPKPERYPLTSLEECIKAANVLPFNDEGYVVVDKNLNRLKIKSPAYVAVHHLKGEGIISEKRALDLIRANEHNEFLTYYEEYREIFAEIEKKYKSFLKSVQRDTILAKQYLSDDRKTYAEWAKTKQMPSILFSFYDGKISNVEEGLKGLSSEKLLRYL